MYYHEFMKQKEERIVALKNQLIDVQNEVSNNLPG